MLETNFKEGKANYNKEWKIVGIFSSSYQSIELYYVVSIYKFSQLFTSQTHNLQQWMLYLSY